MTTKRVAAAAGAVVAMFAALVFGVPLLITLNAANVGSAGCGDSDNNVPAGAAAAVIDPQGLDAERTTNARMVIAVGQQMHLPDQAIVIALAVASQESGFRNLANDGLDSHGRPNPQLRPEQRDVGRSLQFPHFGIGHDHGSLGIMQQQYPWWGTMAELMNPQTAAVKFYRALLKVSGWQNMPVTVAAQTVQGSLYPDAYAPHEAEARKLLAANRDAAANAPPLPAGVPVNPGADNTSGPTGNTDSNSSAAQCDTTATPTNSGDGSARLPIDPGHYSISSPFGPRDGRFHAGLDFAANPGTPIYAVTGGTVTAAGDAGDGYGQCVHIVSDDHTVETLYAHQTVGAIKVAVGHHVTAGDLIGGVGSTGDATGPHLHFEVRINGRAVDPVPYLTAKGLRP